MAFFFGLLAERNRWPDVLNVRTKAKAGYL